MIDCDPLAGDEFLVEIFLIGEIALSLFARYYSLRFQQYQYFQLITFELCVIFESASQACLGWGVLL